SGGVVLGSGAQERPEIQRVKSGGAGSLRVVDGNRQLVGVVLGPDAVGAVFGGVPFLLQGVSPSGIADTRTPFSFFYVTSDCSGEPYGRPNSGGLFTPHVVSGHSIYYVP